METEAGMTKKTEVYITVNAAKLVGDNTKDNYFDAGFMDTNDAMDPSDDEWVPDYGELYYKVILYKGDTIFEQYTYEWDDGTPSDSAEWTMSVPLAGSLTFGTIYGIKIQLFDYDPNSDDDLIDINPETGEVSQFVHIDIANDTFQYVKYKSSPTQSKWSDWIDAGTKVSTQGNGDETDTGDAKITFTYDGDNRPDTSAPAVDNQNPSSPDGANGWYKTTIDYNCIIKSDNEWLPSECYFRLKIGDAPLGDTKYYGTWTSSSDSIIAGGQGTASFKLYAYDPLGNHMTALDVTIKVDKTPPTVSQLTGPKGTVTTDKVTFSWTGTDAGTSGIDKYYFYIDSGTPLSTTATTVTKTTPADGQHTFWVWAKDKAGNTGAIQSLVFNVDQTPGTVTGLTGPEGWVATDQVEFYWEGLDQPSVIKNYEYKMDEGTVVSTTEKIVLLDTPSDGTHTFSVRVIKTGSVPPGEWFSATFKVDRQRPTLTGLVGPEGWIKGSTAHFTWSGTDATSGIKRYIYVVDDGDPQEVAEDELDLADPPEGQHTLTVQAEDNAGNLGDVASVTFKVDRTAPSVTDIMGPESWISDAKALFRFVGDDSGDASLSSGVAEFTYCVDSGTDQPATNPIELDMPADGEHTLKVRATDVAGNTGEYTSYVFKVDRTAPRVTELTGPEGWITLGSATFEWTGDDGAGASSSSGIDYYVYSVDGADEMHGTSPLELGALHDGDHTLRVKAVDRAGNIGAVKSLPFKADVTPPEMASVVAPTGWITGDTMQVTFAGTDAASGMDHFLCKVDDGTEEEGSSPLSLDTPTDGAHTLSVKGVDKAGNAGEAMTAEFKVDKSKPTVESATLPSGGMKTKTRDITLVVDVKDDKDGSNIKCVRYKVGNGAWTEVLVEESMTSGTVEIAMTLPNKEGQTDVLLKTEDLAGNVGNEYTATVNYAPEKKASMLPIILIIIVVLVVMLLLFMRTERGRALMTRSSTPKSEMETRSGQFGGTQGGRMAGPSIAAPPPKPMAPVAPVATVAAAGVAAGSFRVLNVKAQCPTCGSSIERGTSAYVCSCGTAVHEQCAGRIKICPGCKKEIRFG